MAKMGMKFSFLLFFTTVPILCDPSAADAISTTSLTVIRIPSHSDIESPQKLNSSYEYDYDYVSDKNSSESVSDKKNDTQLIAGLISLYTRIVTDIKPPEIEKRGMMGQKNMMKMMKKTNKMNMIMNMMNGMMKYKMKKKKMKYKYKSKKLKYKLAKEIQKDKMKKYKMKYKGCSYGKGKKSQFVNVQKVSFKKVPVPIPVKGKGKYGGYAEPEAEYGFKGFPEPEFFPFPEPEVYPLPEPEITVNKKFVNYNYDYGYNYYGQNPTVVDTYEYEYEYDSGTNGTVV